MTTYHPANHMDPFGMTDGLPDLASVSLQSPLFGSFPQPSQIKQQQKKTYPQTYSVPLYSPIEDFDFTTDFDSNPSLGSPITPDFNSFSVPSGSDEWAEWDKLTQSPQSDFFNFKSETDFDTTDLSSIPMMTSELSPLDVSNAGGLEDSAVVFGREGVNDTRPLFQSPQIMTSSFSIPQQQQQQQQQQRGQSATPAPLSIKTSPSHPETQTQSASLPTEEQTRRYPARANNLKRKSSADYSSTHSSPRSSCSPPPHQRRHTSSTTPKDDTKPMLGPKKTAHNMIEKRYRTNLNDKIAALRDSVPALRVMVHRLEHNPAESGDDEESTGKQENQQADVHDLGGLAPAHKLNKATILSKATEYIAHLERQNRSLVKENSALRNRVEGFEMLVMSRGNNNIQRGPVWN